MLAIQTKQTWADVQSRCAARRYDARPGFGNVYFIFDRKGCPVAWAHSQGDQKVFKPFAKCRAGLFQSFAEALALN